MVHDYYEDTCGNPKCQKPIYYPQDLGEYFVLCMYCARTTRIVLVKPDDEDSEEE